MGREIISISGKSTTFLEEGIVPSSYMNWQDIKLIVQLDKVSDQSQAMIYLLDPKIIMQRGKKRRISLGKEILVMLTF